MTSGLYLATRRRTGTGVVGVGVAGGLFICTEYRIEINIKSNDLQRIHIVIIPFVWVSESAYELMEDHEVVVHPHHLQWSPPLDDIH